VDVEGDPVQPANVSVRILDTDGRIPAALAVIAITSHVPPRRNRLGANCMAATAQATTAAAADHSEARTMALAMFAVLLVSYTLMSADRYLISMLGPDIRAALGLSLPQMGALTTMFTLGIAIAGLPGGALIARYSRRAVLILGIGLCSVATLLFTQASLAGSCYSSASVR
jgi:sugar phosphate permease